MSKRIMNGSIVIGLFIFSFLFLPGTAHAGVSPSAAFRGNSIAATYAPTSKQCAYSVEGEVWVGGFKANVESWLSCSGYVTFTVPSYVTGGDVILRLSDGTDVTAGKLTILLDPIISSVNLTAAKSGDRIILLGSNFGDVFWEGTLSVGSTEITKALWSNTKIEFEWPATTNASKINVRHYEPDTGFSSAAETPYIFLQPAITVVNKSTFFQSETLEIYGQQFENNFPGTGRYSLQVYIGGQAVGSSYIKSWDDGIIMVEIPDFVANGIVEITITDSQTGTILRASGPSISVLKPSARDQLSVVQQYLQQVKVDQAWQYTHGSKDVVVAVIDSGVDTNNIDLTDNIWSNTDEIPGNKKDDDRNGFIDDVHGYDFVANVAELTPYDGHGTMVAGIIGAVGNNNVGITGISWSVQIMPLIALNRRASSLENVKKAIKYAADNGADIINLSLGGFGWTNDYQDELTASIKYAFDKGILVVAAAGNGDAISGPGRNLDINPNSPVCNDGAGNYVLGVGSVNAADLKSEFSDYGRNCIDVMAPGENIVSLSPRAFSSFGVESDINSGTSFSAPIVSGVAALIKARYPSITNKEIIARIMRNADSIDGLNPTYAGRLGAGRVNAFRALSEPFVQSPEQQEVELNRGIVVDTRLVNKLKGTILLQVEDGGKAWYVHPDFGKRYYLKDGNAAYEAMRAFGLGVTDENLGKIPSAANVEEIAKSSSKCAISSLANKLKGKILIQVQQLGEAWYVHPDTCLRIYMKDGATAYQIMRFLSLGINNENLSKIPIGIFSVLGRLAPPTRLVESRKQTQFAIARPRLFQQADFANSKTDSWTSSVPEGIGVRRLHP